MDNIEKISNLIAMLAQLKEDPRIADNTFVSDILDEMIQTSNYGTRKHRLSAIQECLSYENLEELDKTVKLDIMDILQPVEEITFEDVDTSSIDHISFSKFCRDNNMKLTKKDLKLFSEDV